MSYKPQTLAKITVSRPALPPSWWRCALRGRTQRSRYHAERSSNQKNMQNGTRLAAVDLGSN
ncbi:MAG TPA: hypothetical protein VGE29_04705, partial [Prosthecobacter sp.]